MSPVTNENNTTNLNAAFVTDNSLEVAEGNGNIEQSSEEEIAEVLEIDGNIEAETNKSANNSNIKKEEMKSHETTTIISTTEDKNTATKQDAVEHVENQALTIEDNEERNCSPNESSFSDIEADAATAIDDNNTTSATIEPETDLRIEMTEGSIKESSTESVEIDDVTKPDDSTEWVGDDTIDTPGEGVDEIGNDPNENRYASYGSNKNREDISSSDDEEDDDTIEMHPEFNAEWADLRDDLKKKDDGSNDLSNDIDVYEAVPVDLSNDIAVNDLAAANPDFLINPDAEVITVSSIRNSGVIHKFEKMSMGSILTSDK